MNLRSDRPLTRRHVLRGAGDTLGLPSLASLAGADRTHADTAAAEERRLTPESEGWPQASSRYRRGVPEAA